MRVRFFASFVLAYKAAASLTFCTKNRSKAVVPRIKNDNASLHSFKCLQKKWSRCKAECKGKGMSYSKIPSIFDHVVHDSSTIESNYQQPYAAAVPLDPEEVEMGLEGINRDKLAGLRDYAILAVALSTGRRSSELVGLRAKDLKITSTTRQKP